MKDLVLDVPIERRIYLLRKPPPEPPPGKPKTVAGFGP